MSRSLTRRSSLTPSAPLEQAGELMPVEAKQPLSKREKTVITDQHYQQTVMRAQAEKAALGLQFTEALEVGGMATFDDGVGRILAIKDAPGKTDEHRAYAAAFSSNLISGFHNHTLALIHAGVYAIAREVDRDLYREEEPNWKQRLFG